MFPEGVLLEILNRIPGVTAVRAVRSVTLATNPRLYPPNPAPGLYVIGHPATGPTGAGWVPRYVGQTGDLRRRMLQYHRHAWILNGNPGRLRVWLAFAPHAEPTRLTIERNLVQTINPLLQTYGLRPLANTQGAAEGEFEWEFERAYR